MGDAAALQQHVENRGEQQSRHGDGQHPREHGDSDRLAQVIRAGEKLGPRLFSTGTILYGAETPFKAVVENYDDALFHVRRMKAAGAISVKSYNQQRRDVRQMLIKAAREEQMMVVPEGGSLFYQNATHVLDGHTTVEHNIPVPVLYKDVLTVYGKSGVAYTPTLIVGYGGMSGELYWYQESNVWENERLMQFTPRDVIVPRSRRRPPRRRAPRSGRGGRAPGRG